MEKLPRFIPFGAPKFSKAEEQEVLKTLRSGWIGAGPKTLLFEQQFARYIGVPHAVALSSCTAGLHLSLYALGIGEGDEVITTPLTFVATANAIFHTGARVRFADIDETTMNIDPKRVAEVISKKTKAILPVHYGGLPVDLDALKKIARKFGIPIVEDAAHAVGARYKGKKIGASGNVVVFSFYPNKNITTCEGGMVTTSNFALAKKLQVLRMHGLDADAWKRFHRKTLKVSLEVEPGFKYNLTDFQSSLGIHQLKRVEAWQKKREQYARVYDKLLLSIPGVRGQYRPKDVARNRHALHLYIVRLTRSRFGKVRDRVVQELLSRNIGASIHYYPVHLHPYFRKLGFKKGSFPIAERVAEEIFTLPLTPHLSASDVFAIGRITRDVLTRI